MSMISRNFNIVRAVKTWQPLFSRARGFHLSPVANGINEDFEAAKNRMNTLKNEPDNVVKLKIYALFKQANVGKCNAPKPGMMDFVGKAKWDAWNSLGDMSQDAAKTEYINIIQELAADEGPAEESTPSSDETKQFEGFKVTKENGVCTLMLNRPNKKNAITTDMYDSWRLVLEDAAKDPQVRVLMVTGAGDYFCSGNDLSNFMIPPDQMVELANRFGKMLQRFVGAFIDFPKPLIGALNGPAVGISVTTLGLYDAVFAVEHCTLHTPFSNLGQTPEGCSSVTFPELMGLNRANEMIMFNKRITAQEAYERGLVTRVLPRDNFDAEVKKIATEYAQLPPQSVMYAKELVLGPKRKLLHETNEIECNRLKERWLSDECKKAIIAFFQRKK